MSDFLRKSPKLFELYENRRGVLWRGMTKQAEERVEEEDRILEEHQDKAVEYVTCFIMMFELEKKTVGITEASAHTSGLISPSFPLKFLPNYQKRVYKYRGALDHFQKRSYLSPYADARGLNAGSKEFDKRAVAIMHELLSFTVEKRLVTDRLTHFRQELVMPQKLMRLFLSILAFSMS
ncbi:hypothetical protein M0R45_001983 [Rubus argutus]|uniref:PORR domain-containing protein n=1 Tax=Rubus argutus TaxID=59490 RepID=A0AAW1VKR3_RUBAR